MRQILVPATASGSRLCRRAQLNDHLASSETVRQILLSATYASG